MMNKVTPPPLRKGDQSLLNPVQAVHLKLVYLHKKPNLHIQLGDYLQSPLMGRVTTQVTTGMNPLYRLQQQHLLPNQTLHPPRKRVRSQPKVMPLGKNTRLASTSAGCVHTEVTVPVILPDIIVKSME